MRLIETKSKPLRLVEFNGSDVPPYVILPHCWTDNEESFKDLNTDCEEAKKKKGLAKSRNASHRLKRMDMTMLG